MYMSQSSSAFTAFTKRHPAQISSIPTTLTAQMPRPFVRAAPFAGSRFVVQDTSNMEAYNRVQDLTEDMDFKPISKKKQKKPTL